MFLEAGAVSTQKYVDYHFAQVPNRDALVQSGNCAEGRRLSGRVMLRKKSPVYPLLKPSAMKQHKPNDPPLFGCYAKVGAHKDRAYFCDKFLLRPISCGQNSYQAFLGVLSNGKVHLSP